jgi:hypothetical protein
MTKKVIVGYIVSRINWSISIPLWVKASSPHYKVTEQLFLSCLFQM